MKRLESVEVVRVLAIFAVVVIHTQPFLSAVEPGQPSHYWLGVLLKQAATFAVPFFFIVSGYFWGTKVRAGEDVFTISKAAIRRVLLVFVVWSLIYATPYNIGAFHEYGLTGPIRTWYWSLHSLAENPADILLQGSMGHLWFLPALVFAIFISALFVKSGRIVTLMFCSVFLYGLGVLVKGYADTPLGFHVHFNPRNGPLYSTIFFSLGYVLSAMTPRQTWLYYGGVLLAAGVLIKYVELYLLWSQYGASPLEDYLIGTIPMGLGVAMMALSGALFPGSRLMAEYGKYTLGIFAGHMVFVEILRPLGLYLPMFSWQILYPILVFLITLVVVRLLARNHLFKHVLM